MKYVSKSQNKKISKTLQVDSTYAPISQSCPDSCQLKNNGCYASLSFVGMINRKLEKEASGLSALEVAKLEAKAIDESYSGKAVPNVLLRLHVSGDSTSLEGSKLINAAVGRWKKRGGNINGVWSYSHVWKDIPRSAWSNVSMLASVDDYADIPLAIKRGYVPAIVVNTFPKHKKFSIPGSPIDFLPCPAQIKEDVSCDSCQLCLRDDLLKSLNVGIAFEAHSAKVNDIKRRLPVIK